jgi:hypothetical protein
VTLFIKGIVELMSSWKSLINFSGNFMDESLLMIMVTQIMNNMLIHSQRGLSVLENNLMLGLCKFLIGSMRLFDVVIGDEAVVFGKVKNLIEECFSAYCLNQLDNYNAESMVREMMRCLRSSGVVIYEGI